MTRLQMYRHAKRIAAENKIKVEITPRWLHQMGSHGMSRKDIRTIRLIWPVWSEEMYATFLHEAGHILSPNQIPSELSNGMAYFLGEPKYQRANEIDAWKWATANAIGWTERMTAFALTALRTYGISLETV